MFVFESDLFCEFLLLLSVSVTGELERLLDGELDNGEYMATGGDPLNKLPLLFLDLLLLFLFSTSICIAIPSANIFVFIWRSSRVKSLSGSCNDLND